MPRRFDKLITSAMSRPVIDGSESTAPTILKPGRLATCRATAAPIGPRPKCITRMLGMVQQYSVATEGRRAVTRALRHERARDDSKCSAIGGPTALDKATARPLWLACIRARAEVERSALPASFTRLWLRQ